PFSKGRGTKTASVKQIHLSKMRCIMSYYTTRKYAIAVFKHVNVDRAGLTPKRVQVLPLPG
ncbi:MAG: hypothetical protein OEY40_00610, partial [Candidatus Bathyarchaeota archaeon]|nr:hypothetical protein [Candidatus Bathyarchaeota archaeon]